MKVAQITSDTTEKLFSAEVAPPATDDDGNEYQNEDSEQYKKMEIQADVLKVFEAMVRILKILFQFLFVNIYDDIFNLL